MRFFFNCFSLIWAQNLDAQTGILVSKTLWTPSLIFLIGASTVSIKSTQHDIIRKFYKLEQSAICRLHLLITVSFSFKFCQNHISTSLAGDIQLLCYHKMTKIWTPPPSSHLFEFGNSQSSANVHKFSSTPYPPTPYKNSLLYGFIIS